MSDASAVAVLRGKNGFIEKISVVDGSFTAAVRRRATLALWH
jgi:hypothetical protein